MYQVLARKYRPRNFNELVGQNHVSRALTSALERGRLHHAYLFTGTRGVGKTTIARILAKCLNCETGVTSTPCEVCPTCTAVNEGRFIDLIEIDAASRTKVEDTRELLDNVPYAPTQGRFKVYLIDEVHMLSTHSFNALLKTLEEPPEHVKFLFATTDPQKLPITVISRCLQFTLRPLAVDEITEHLANILNKESIQAEQDAIWQIAESAQGSLRDALSLTDQAIAYGQGAIQHQDVKEMLGLIDRTIIYDLILAIHQNQKQRVSELLMQFRQQALDVSLVLDQLISTLHELALLQYLPELSLKYSAEINKKIMQLSQQIAAQDLQLYYQIACKGRAELQLAVTQEQGFEMSVLRMLAFRPLQPNEVLVAQTNSAVVESESVQQTAILTSDPETALQQDAQDADVDAAFEDAAITQNAEPEFDDGNLSENAEESKPPVDSSQQSDQIVFDPSSDEVLFDLDEADEFNTQTHDDEPNSDDFLFDEIVPLDIETQNDASVEPAAVIAEPAVQTESFDLASGVLSADSVQNTQVVENESQQAVATIVESAQLEQVSSASADLMPQDILQLQPQQLAGEWTVEKWEYWFRSSGLSPAVQELAQQGLMAGQINAESVFMIPQRYEQLLTQLRHILEDALKAEWPQTRFDVKYAEVETITPYTMQAQRKQKAFQRAHELLQNEDTVKGLVQTFDGELQNIQLK
ncbi:DNA polymerase III subunit gamma/tau [Acinetobacter johnsonii]|jgi:DNA polymerase III subunit gamma/tau|uniref:DNA polymerase III subunit gamma/tau n=1 Tax=Acinetobacter johnsonii TaxID=40214 RepID=UPI0021CD7FA6|nr:DNA polymerase III subunit gamma/tau [Acinetobacter johnsonii]MCU4326451.1 DNA polymerase III subunit gamma/tau [Acinetobacter johnsonii]MDH1407560.1 DNA polymerase III subunit gamma/tau [Acinetobacter johnsonii]